VTPRSSSGRIVLALLGGVLAAFLVLPLAGLLFMPASDFRNGLGHPLVWPALRLSLLTTTTSLFLTVLLGTPLAWTLAQSSGRWARVAGSLVELPIVIPPAVAGVALLLAFGRRGLVGGALPDDLAVVFTTSAVIMAELFVSAPFFVQAAANAFRRIDPRLLVVARTFGAPPLRVFLRVAVPLAAPGLVAGAAMAWARSLGEFGATLMFAGNLEGVTQTLPLAIYTALESDLDAARALSIVLLVFACAVLFGARALLRSAERAEPDA
jgi:molybdate transport system permease protein